MWTHFQATILRSSPSDLIVMQPSYFLFKWFDFVKCCSIVSTVTYTACRQLEYFHSDCAPTCGWSLDSPSGVRLLSRSQLFKRTGCCLPRSDLWRHLQELGRQHMVNLILQAGSHHRFSAFTCSHFPSAASIPAEYAPLSITQRYTDVIPAPQH